MASALVLKRDGSFLYFLSMGSLDEQAAGKWRREGKLIRLETIPKPIAAIFAAGSVAKSDGAPLILHVVSPEGRGIAAVDLKVGFDTGEPVEGYTQDYGWSLAAEEGRVPRWVQFFVPIYGLQSARFAIDTAVGNALTFVLIPNDLGILDMADIVLEVQPGRLLMHRNGGELEFDLENAGAGDD
ncbi:hypothetical protein LWE61_16725 [Sphingobium sufflavum]|uniref:hypothetical protein n=1 Tax=Sphingobium sufflavum TaxID=1129547 RepID=UPI001F1BC62A|nr:hypothetical protein [Sphingobium sufflavum]MCE7798186.1 hypothetical protein [Sphingobium sufflavum]